MAKKKKVINNIQDRNPLHPSKKQVPEDPDTHNPLEMINYHRIQDKLKKKKKSKKVKFNHNQY